jgi:hypothetical protein
MRLFASTQTRYLLGPGLCVAYRVLCSAGVLPSDHQDTGNMWEQRPYATRTTGA